MIGNRSLNVAIGLSGYEDRGFYTCGALPARAIGVKEGLGALLR